MARRILSHLAHVELLTPQLEESAAFFTNTLGLVETARAPRSVYLRCWGEYYHHSLVLTAAAQPGLGHAAWRTDGPDELNEAAARIEASGIRGEWRDNRLGTAARTDFAVQADTRTKSSGKSIASTHPPT